MFAIENIVKGWPSIANAVNSIYCNEHYKPRKVVIEQIGKSILAAFKDNPAFVMRQFNVFITSTLQEPFYDEIERNDNHYFLCFSITNGAVMLLTNAVNRKMKELYNRECTCCDIDIISEILDAAYVIYTERANRAYEAACV